MSEAKTPNREEAKKHLQDGVEFLNRGNNEEACKALERAIEIYPDSSPAYLFWGVSLGKLERYKEAIEKFEKATEADPQNTSAYYNWGVVLGELGQHEEAIEKYKKATEVDPRHAIAFNNWGNALTDMKRHEEAIKKYEKATEVDPKNADAYYNWGNALGELGQQEEAIEKYEKATEADPKHAGVYTNWGNVLGDLGSHEEAIEKYLESKKLDPDLPYPYHNMAYLFWSRGEYASANREWEETRKTYERAIKKEELSRNADLFGYLGNVLHVVFGELVEAEEIYKKGLDLDGNNIPILIGLVELNLEKRDQCDRDENSDDKSGTKEYSFFEMCDSAASAHTKAREFYKSAEKLLKVHIKESDQFNDVLRLGNLYGLMGEYEKAEEVLLKAQKKNENSAEVMNVLGIVCERRKRFKKAVQCFEKAVRRKPESFTFRSNLAEAYLKTKRVEEAEEEYQKILRITPNHVESQIGMGEVYTAMGDEGEEEMYEAALEHYIAALKLAKSPASSRRLRRKELAALHYSRGYARVKHYEASNASKDVKLLHNALKVFKECALKDPDHHKAKRAVARLKERLRFFSGNHIRDVVAPWAIFLLSTVVFLAIQAGFYFKFPAEIDVKLYVPMTFGLLIFMVAGIYLPQVLRLKVGSIELEKSSIDQVRPTGTLEISR